MRNISINTLGDGGFAPIPANSKPAVLPEVIHYWIQFDKNGNNLSFSITLLENTDPNIVTLDDYLRDIIKHPRGHIQMLGGVNPLDINIWKPAMVIVEIDNTCNWRFKRSKRGMTVPPQPHGQYSDLMHVVKDANGDPQVCKTYAPKDVDCHVIYFTAQSTPGRLPANAPPSDAFNLYVEFTQGFDANGNEKVVPLIIDPDIQDKGPPPPPHRHK